MSLHLLITCEHAVNTIPPAWQYLFARQKAVLNTHRAIDFGALELAQALQQQYPQCDYFIAKASRLLIECNRSINHPRCFSEFTTGLDETSKQEIIADYYQAYRNQVIQTVKNNCKTGLQTLHLSIHSFTPELNGIVRNADLGLLYDPRRDSEKAMADAWVKLLNNIKSGYRIRKNYPYKGISDGLVTSIRKITNTEQYIGFEIEQNQALVFEQDKHQHLISTICKSLAQLVPPATMDFKKT